MIVYITCISRCFLSLSCFANSTGSTGTIFGFCSTFVSNSDKIFTLYCFFFTAATSALGTADVVPELFEFPEMLWRSLFVSTVVTTSASLEPAVSSFFLGAVCKASFFSWAASAFLRCLVLSKFFPSIFLHNNYSFFLKNKDYLNSANPVVGWFRISSLGKLMGVLSMAPTTLRYSLSLRQLPRTFPKLFRALLRASVTASFRAFSMLSAFCWCWIKIWRTKDLSCLPLTSSLHWPRILYPREKRRP